MIEIDELEIAQELINLVSFLYLLKIKLCCYFLFPLRFL